MSSFSSDQVNLRRTEPEPQLIATTDDLGWSSMYSAILEEIPHHNEYEAIPHLWISTVPDSITYTTVVLQGKRKQGPVPSGAIFMCYNHGPATVTQDNPIHLHHAYIRTEVVEDVAATFFKGDPKNIELAPIFGGDDPIVSALLSSVRHAMVEAKSYHGALFSDYLARSLAARLLTSYATKQDLRLPGTQVGRFNRWRADDVIHYMRENLASDISIEELAKITHYSPTHFTRIFKNTFNCTPHAFLTKLRIDRAKELLTSSSLTIGAIGMLCGFVSHSHFSSMFRRCVGISPAEYRMKRSL